MSFEERPVGIASQSHATLTLRLNSVKYLFSMLSAIYNGKKDCFATVSANAKGFRASVENASKSMFATSLLKQDLFDEFNIDFARGECTEIRFKVNLAALLECLAVYGSPALPLTSLHLAFSEEDAKLHMLLEEGGVTTECSLATADFSGGDFAEDFAYDVAFKRYPIIAKAVILSDVLHDAIREMAEQPQATSVALTMSPKEPFFRLHTASSFGAATVDIKANSDAFISFDCATEITHTFYLPLLESLLRALAASDQSFVRMNAAGMLSIANKVKSDSNSVMFVQFMLMPNEEMKEDGGQQDAGDAGMADE